MTARNIFYSVITALFLTMYIGLGVQYGFWFIAPEGMSMDAAAFKAAKAAEQVPWIINGLVIAYAPVLWLWFNHGPRD